MLFSLCCDHRFEVYSEASTMAKRFRPYSLVAVVVSSSICLLSIFIGATPVQSFSCVKSSVSSSFSPTRLDLRSLARRPRSQTRRVGFVPIPSHIVSNRHYPSCHVLKHHVHFGRTKLSETTSSSSSSSWNDSQGTGTASIPNEIFNLVKSIIGAGVLSLPAGIAAFGNAPSALLPATVLIAIMGTISAYTFSMIARVCSTTGATSYAEAWEKSRGTRWAWLVAASSALDCWAGNLTYSMVLADTVKDLLAAIGIITTRSQALVGLTSTVLLPLCLVKNLSSLAPFSLLGILGMAYTSIAIGIRFFGGMYAPPAGRFVSDLALSQQPAFGSVGVLGAWSPKSLLLICMLSTAYIAHFNAPKFYAELKNNTMKRFNTVVISSFGIAIAIYASVSAMGFLTFGSATASMILNNYSTQDILMSVSRFAVALSLIFSYPLLFVGTRDGLLDLLGMFVQGSPSERMKNRRAFVTPFSMATLLAITTMALFVKDLTLVASLSGAVLGTALIFIYPTLMFRGVVQALGDKATQRQRWESRFCTVIALLGVAIGGVGARMALS
jgi:amino acid permease